VQILVTGATGFVGGQLAAELVRRGDTVRVLRRANSNLTGLDGLPVEHVIGDILEPDAVARAIEGCERVFHVAAVSTYLRTTKEQLYRVNVEGTRIVMEACRRAGVPRVVHTSSVAAIGVPRDGVPADEEMPFDAFSAGWAYADSKHRAEAEVQRAVQAGLAAVIVNPAAVVGPGDHYLVASAAIELARRQPPLVPPGGVCVVDVAAVVAGHLLAAERGRVGQRYILGGENLTNMQIMHMICEIAHLRKPIGALPKGLLGPAASVVDLFNRVSGRPPTISGEQLRLAVNRVYYDSSKAVRELGYPLLPIRPAAERAHRWYVEHGYLK
jgi:dihydroflavonol-4-reductase